MVIDDKVRIKCPNCNQVFRDRAGRVRSGYQANCTHCNRLLTFSAESENPNIRRALKAARDLRSVLEAEAMRARAERYAAQQ